MTLNVPSITMDDPPMVMDAPSMTMDATSKVVNATSKVMDMTPFSENLGSRVFFADTDAMPPGAMTARLSNLPDVGADVRRLISIAEFGIWNAEIK